MTDENVSFPLFLALWNRRQGQDTPALHFRMARWLESAWARGDTRLLLMAFRSSGKSTVTGLFSAWLLMRRPELRILVLAADGALARKTVRTVKRIIERHPLTAPLKPERADQWASDRFTVRRGLELRDPSMLARGVPSNITGSRADVVICDDVEVPNTCDTPEKRLDLRERLAEIDYVLTPGGTQLYVGTPHTFETIYDTAGLLKGFSDLRIPVLDGKGGSAWPERFAPADIERIRTATGPNKFASQMMLVPVNIADGRLDPDALVPYAGELSYSKQLKGLYLEGKRLVSASAWWDPAFGRGGDHSVLAAVFTDEEGTYRLHRVVYIDGMISSPMTPLLNPPPFQGGGEEERAERPDDEATAQCRRVAQIAKELHLPSIALEINGLGRFLPGILKKVLAGERVPCAVREMSSRRPKELRIIEAFDAVLAARKLHVHESVLQTPLLTEMREWRPGYGGHDDGLDAVAGALSLEPVRIGGGGFTPRQSWQGAGRTEKARTEFEI